MKQHTDKFLKKRKFLMVLPLLVLPFLSMIFWALGGGQGVPSQAAAMDVTGLNLALPDAHFDEKEIWDKLSLYEMAERDSAKYEEARESDPYFDLIAFQSEQDQPKTDTIRKDNKLIDSFKQKDRLSVDPNEDRVNRKLQELYAEINKSSTVLPETSNRKPATNSDPQFTADVDRLEKMMETMHEGGEADPELQQIESMLEKILDIQHPERVREKLKAMDTQSKANALQVEVIKNDENISLLSSSALERIASQDSVSLPEVLPAFNISQNGFFGLDDETLGQVPEGNAIEAIIHDTQELVAGATVKLRLLNDIEINGRQVPKDQFVYGVCSINGERLTVEISSIRTGNALLPVSLEVYDLDGLPGIYIPGAITRDAAKQASEDAMQNIQLMSLDPGIGTQAAAAGVEAAKGLFSKKAKLIKVTVKAGYHVLLKDTNPSSL